GHGSYHTIHLSTSPACGIKCAPVIQCEKDSRIPQPNSNFFAVEENAANRKRSSAQPRPRWVLSVAEAVGMPSPITCVFLEGRRGIREAQQIGCFGPKLEQ